MGEVFVIVDKKGNFATIDPSCGWPVFDEILVGRTIRWAMSKDAEQYVNNLTSSGLEDCKVIMVSGSRADR